MKTILAIAATVMLAGLVVLAVIWLAVVTETRDGKEVTSVECKP